MPSYAELLLDPRWILRKTQVLQRDHYQCQWCDDHEYGMQGELHVHHKKYYDDWRMPWDYQDEDLITLCDICHTLFHQRDNAVKKKELERQMWESISKNYRLFT